MVLKVDNWTVVELYQIPPYFRTPKLRLIAMQSLDEDYLLELHQLIVWLGSTLVPLQLPFEKSLDLESLLKLNREQLQELTLFREPHPNEHFLSSLPAHNNLLKQFLIADGSPAYVLD
jgi:hypothetical protein